MYRRLGVVFLLFSFFSHADQGVPVSLHPRQTSPAGTGERKRFTVALKLAEFDDAPKISQNDGQVQPGSLAKHWWGRDHRGF